MRIDDLVEVRRDDPELDCPVVHRRSDEWRRHRELRPARPHVNRELHRIENRRERIAGKANNENANVEMLYLRHSATFGSEFVHENGLRCTPFCTSGSMLSTPKFTPTHPARAMLASVSSSRQSMRVSHFHVTRSPRRTISSQIATTRFFCIENIGSRNRMCST